MSRYLKLIRVHQWHKNAFVLAGFFALGDYTNTRLLTAALINVLAFCFLSSAVYIINDFHDRHADRAHPVKRYRPLASGTVPVAHAFLLAAVLFVAALGLGRLNGLVSVLILMSYFVITLAYTFGLKHLPIVDVFLIAFGFILRLLAGTSGIAIEVSEWLLLTGFTASLLIGFVKRYGELAKYQNAHSHRLVLNRYSPAVLKTYISIMSGCTILLYMFYTVSPHAQALRGSTSLIYTVPFVIFGILRFLHLVFQDMTGDDPSELFMKDRILLITVMLWAVVFGWLAYQ